MKIYHSLRDIDPAAGIVLAMGIFDGCHKGHEEVFRRTFRIASEKKAIPAVLTMDPHPYNVLHPEHPLPLLQTLGEKEVMLKKEGFAVMIVLPVTKAFLKKDALDFLKSLRALSGLQGIVVGENYTFGNQAEGRPDLLKRFFDGSPVEVAVVPLLKDHTLERVSSSKIRACLEKGEVEEAARLLGRNYRLSGEVVHGFHRGHDILGFPTANLKPDAGKLVPADGVYAVRAWIDGAPYPAVTNVGTNPTFHNTERTIETFILSFNESIYGRPFSLEWVKRLRGEIQFPDFESLKKQIQKDAEEAGQILSAQ